MINPSRYNYGPIPASHKMRVELAISNAWMAGRDADELGGKKADAEIGALMDMVGAMPESVAARVRSMLVEAWLDGYDSQRRRHVWDGGRW